MYMNMQHYFACTVTKEKVINFLDKLSDEALKKEATTEAKSDTFSSIMKVSKHWWFAEVIIVQLL